MGALGAGVVGALILAKSKKERVDERAAEILEAKSQITAIKKEARAEREGAEQARLAAAEERGVAKQLLEQNRNEETRREKERRIARATAEKERAEMEAWKKRLENQEKRHLKEEEELAGRVEALAGLSADEARDFVVDHARRASREALRRLAKEGEAMAERTAEARARDLLLEAIQRVEIPALLAEDFTDLIKIPEESWKGRIIGKGGRNVKSFQERAGVDLIIDESLQIVIASHDGLRRAIAKRALEQLIADGRIHPPAIEAEIERAEEGIEEEARERGARAAQEAGVEGLHREVERMMGHMGFRSSMGQNLLLHSVECARIANLLARTIGLDSALLSRMAFLHDIGKALPDAGAGIPHAEAGARFLLERGESAPVANGVACHHGEVAPENAEAALVGLVDALSSARPGARRENTEEHMERLEAIEALGMEEEGVASVYAVSAGREVRVVLDPDRSGDRDPTVLAERIGRRIREELEIPGSLTITVIRERRGRVTL